MGEKLPLLVVDDDPIILKLFQDFLGRKHQVLLASDGEQALEVLRREKVAAILCDQMMPGLTGVEVLSASLELQPHAVRMLITAGDRLENLQKAVNEARIHRFLVKPVRLLEFDSTVQGALREVELERQNESLVAELKSKNELLQRALAAVQKSEHDLEHEVQARTAELREAVAQLSELALRDGLTGLYNHRFFQEALTNEISRASRHQRTAALIFIDVDHFKHYNDMHGHQAGDSLLRTLARFLNNTQTSEEIPIRGRVSDIAARYGGEEFVIILPETDRAGALIRAERLRATIAEHPFPGEQTQPGGRVTISIGVSGYPEDALTKQELIEAADQALLRAKRNGRNQVLPAGE